MRIEHEYDDGVLYRIVGYCNIPSFESTSNSEQAVISFTRNVYLKKPTKWSTSSSMCLPSDVKSAKVILDCYNLAYAELEKHL